ncbi:hypothetical protein O181_107997, partial [Austropuccinia psidii MF-1]|nr:hypothetical protein [Austropuccinia psidii MF-1]
MMAMARGHSSLGRLSPMGFKRHKQNPPNPPRKDSPVPSLPREQTRRQPTPGPSGTQWSEELFR